MRHEGLRLKPYRDTAGKLTIGVGRNLDDVGVSEAEAFALLNYIATRGDRAAEFAALTSYGVPHKQLAALLPKEAEDVKESLPFNHDLEGKIVLEDDDWGSRNLEKAVNRFREWQLE